MTPTLFALLVCAGGLFASGSRTLYLQMIFCLFGAAAAIALPALGGATITPAVMFLPFVIVRAWLERNRSRPFWQISRAGFWLALLALWGVVSAVVLPRLFTDQVQILTIDRDGPNGAITALFPIRPVSGNITQSGYALGAVAAFLSTRALLSKRGRMNAFRDATLLLAGLNCAAALLNLGEFYLGLPQLLQYVRTAGYAIFDAYESGGLMRIQGTFPETSVFAAFTLPLFAFAFSLWLSRVRTSYSGWLALASLGLLLLSTSGTAYTGLAIYLGCVALSLAWRGLSRGSVPQANALIVVCSLGIAAGAALLLLKPHVATRIDDFFEVTLMNKMQSSSGVQRSSWNRQAWENFLDTYGVGVGLGSARASSFFLVLLSNVGIAGTLLFLAFVVNVCRSPRSELEPTSAVPRAARQAVLASLIASCISGTVFDLGVAFYAFAAAATVDPLRLPDEELTLVPYYERWSGAPEAL